jgi:hypothetical protein
VVAAVGADGLLRSAEIATGVPSGPFDLTATALAGAPVLVPGGGANADAGAGSARLARALCRYDAVDGRSGYGWAERLA